MKFFSNRLAASMLSGLLLSPMAAIAETPEEFYTGKTVTLTVAASTGGMADSVARGFANILQKHIPGNPEIIIQNMPGAGGLVGGAYIMNAAKADGTEIGFLLGNVVTTPLVTGKEAQFDPRKVSFLGAVDSDDYPYAMYAFDSSPVQTAKDAFETEMVVGSTSFTNYNRVFPAMLNEYVGTKFDIISGYKGSGEVYLAMERGEVDGWFEGSQTLRSPIGTSGEFIAAGRMKPLMLMAEATDPRHPDIPVLMNYIEKSEHQAVAKFILASSSVGRPLAVPGDVPDEIVAALRTAMQDAFDDPELAEFMKTSANIAHASLQPASEIEQIISDFYGSPDEILEAVRGFMVAK